jgi:hypothetical protein
MKMLIGSQAAKYWFSDFPRQPKDIDYISEEEINDSDSKFCPSFKYLLEKYPVKIASPEILYTLKVSHSFWDIKWDKTVFDIRFFQSKGIKLNEELFYILYKDCEKRYGVKKAYLNKSNESFFEDGVERKYIHDDIHRAISYYEQPLYEKIKNDNTKALTSKELFLNLSLEDKIKLCEEEIFVTALERFLIPKNFNIPPKVAYLKACKSLIVSMSKGWFPKFIVENYLDISKNNDYNFIVKFKKALNEGKIHECPNIKN